MLDGHRSHRRLTKEEIRGIIAAHQANVPRSKIAVQFQIDVSTVSYHVSRLSGRVYEVVPRPCMHPSLKCLLCGAAQDHIHRREIEKIRDLERQLADAVAILKAHDLYVER